MTGWRGPVATLVFFLALVGIAAGVLHARDSAFTLPQVTERLLYLKSTKAADRLALSFDSLMADIYWIRTIQHYGRDYKNRQQTNRFELLYPLLDMTTTLDPHFLIAYRFGSHFLSARPPEGPGRPDQAIALLEKGLAATPDRWELAHDIGFINYLYVGDFKQAGIWFDKASRMPGAPAWLKQLAATTLARGGDRKSAVEMLLRMNTSEEPYIQRAAERALKQIRAIEGVEQLTAIVNAFKARTGRYPSSWQELIAARMLPGIPLDPANTAFSLDPATGSVSIAEDSPLLPIYPEPVGQMTLPLLLLIALGVVGLMVGSFLNVCISRLPEGESVVTPRSKCPRCGAPIAAYDNIPVVSYLILRGRCRKCGAGISALYPSVEIATAVAFVLQGLVIGADWPLLGARLLFTALLIILFGTDLQTMRLPNAITYPGIVVGLALSLFLPPGIMSAAIGAAIGAGIPWLIRYAWFRAKGVEAMGLGDVKMLAMIGAFLGWQQVWVTLFIASITGAIVGLTLLKSGARAASTKIPFGTFLAVAALAASLAGDALIAWYLGLYSQ